MDKLVKPYQEEGSKKEQVGKMFNNIARSYDLLNRVLSFGFDVRWRKAAIRELGKTNPKVVLDVATGTADLALEIEKQLKPQKIIGVDIANEMLEIGRQKIKRRGLEGKIELLQGDSEKLPFDDNTFDGVAVAFGVRNFENLEKGLSEMERVLKQGGKLVVLEFSTPKVFPFRQLYNFYFRNILPFIGRVTSKDKRAYGYLYESVQAFPDGDAFKKILEEIGFHNAHSKNLTLGICTIYSASK